MKFTIFTLCVSTWGLWAAQGRVIRVSDGDTVTLLAGNDKVKCRLYGIDAPEKKQPYGQESKRFLSQMVLNREVQYEVKDIDIYRRSICVISFDEISSDGVTYHRVVNEQMVFMGLAWAYVQYLKKDREQLKHYLELQSHAVYNKWGLWQDSNPQAPWEYRKQHKRRRRH